MVTENLGPDPSDRRAKAPLTNRSAIRVSDIVSKDTCKAEQIPQIAKYMTYISPEW